MKVLSSLVVLVAFVAGCGSSAVVTKQVLDPKMAATRAVETYDRNKDGKLSGDEWKASPSLTEAVKRIDKNRDGILTGDEIEARFTAQQKQTGLFLIQISVSSKGKALADASVTFTPEPFLGDGLQPYSGTTAENGLCSLEGNDFKTLGIPNGFYQVRIVQAAQGIDAVRGVEIASDTVRDRVEIAL